MKRARATVILSLSALVLSLLTVGQPAVAGDSCYQPDAQIRAVSSSFLGADVYNDDGAGQTERRRLRPGHLDAFRLKFQNDTNDCSDNFIVDGDGNSNGFKVRYFSNGMDVTASVVAGTFMTASLGLGESENLDLTIRAEQGTDAGTVKKVMVQATSASNASEDDTVGAVVKVVKGAGDVNGESA